MSIYTPRTIQEIASDEIAFTDQQGQLDRPFNVNTVIPIRATALSTGQLSADSSRSLVFRDFGIPAGATVVGIELQLEITRLARVQDRVIQVWSGGQARGRNLADLTAGDLHVYGSPTDLWSTENLAVADPGFGFLIDLQPHTLYPSSNLVYLRQLKLRLYTA